MLQEDTCKKPISRFFSARPIGRIKATMDCGFTVRAAVLDHDAAIVQVISVTKRRIEVTPDCFHCVHQILRGMPRDWQQRKT